MADPESTSCPETSHRVYARSDGDVRDFGCPWEMDKLRAYFLQDSLQKFGRPSADVVSGVNRLQFWVPVFSMLLLCWWVFRQFLVSISRGMLSLWSAFHAVIAWVVSRGWTDIQFPWCGIHEVFSCKLPSDKPSIRDAFHRLRRGLTNPSTGIDPVIGRYWNLWPCFRKKKQYTVIHVMFKDFREKDLTVVHPFQKSFPVSKKRTGFRTENPAE